MKCFNNIILEAVNRGIKLALDDYTEFNDSDSNSQDIINNDTYIYNRKRLTELYTALLERDINEDELNEIIDLYDALGIKYVAKDKGDLQIVLSNVIPNNQKANLNWIDVSNVTDMSQLFNRSSFNGDISEWDVSNVETMEEMFGGSQFNGDISNWDVSHVASFIYMFGCSKFNRDISKWNMKNAIDTRYMFNDSKFNQDISNWEISDECDTYCMFKNCDIDPDYMPANVYNA